MLRSIYALFMFCCLATSSSAFAATGSIGSDQPCTLASGATSCTVTVNYSFSGTPIGCVWLVDASPAVVACEGNSPVSFSWANTTLSGSRFELRAHNSFPTNNASGYSSGALLASHAAFARNPTAVSRPNDLSGDSKSDLIFRNSSTGEISAWLMNGGSATSTAQLLGPGNWNVTHTGDFNGDGRADIVFRNDDGASAIWLMNGTSLISGAGLLGAGSGWSVTHVADFNGDGKADLLFRHTDGSVAMWLMNGTALISGAGLLGANSGWTVTHVADFNGDGKADIVFRHDDGRIAVWLMNGLTLTSGAGLLEAASGWSVTHTGDFNGDGKADLLFRHTDGRVAMWLMNGLTRISGAGLPIDASWSATHVADFNGDGKSDILWRNSSGAVTAWLMNGLNNIGSVELQGADPNWRVTHVGDYNGDGKSDIVWRNTNDGSIRMWLIDGTTVLSQMSILGASPWVVVPSLLLARVCDAATSSQIAVCMDAIRVNTMDHLRITQDIVCGNNECAFKLVLPMVSRTVPIEIYGTNPNISITQTLVPTTPIFEITGAVRVSGGTQTTTGVTVQNAPRVQNVTIRDLRLLDSTAVVDTGCKSIPLPSIKDNSPITFKSTSNTVLDNIEIESCAFALVSAQSVNDFRITNSRLRGGKYYGVWIAGYNYGDDGTEYNTRQLVNNGVVIAGNTIRQVGANALFIAGTNNASIYSNVLYGNHRENPFLNLDDPNGSSFPGGQVVVEAGTTNLDFAFNIIRDSKPLTNANGIEFAPTIDLAKIQNINIRSNTIYNISSEAIKFDCLQGAIPTPLNCNFPSAFPKPFAPENVSITNNKFYNTSFDLPASASSARVILIPPDNRFQSINLDSNQYGSNPANASAATFGVTSPSCSTNGLPTCNVVASWSSANVGAAQLRLNGVAFQSNLAGNQTVSIGVPGAILEFYSAALPYEAIARRWIKTN